MAALSGKLTDQGSLKLTRPFPLSWSDDGSRLVIFGGQFEVNIPDAETLELRQTIPFPGATAAGVAFVNVDWKVVVGTIDGKALALTLDTDELISITGERLTQGSSEEEYQFYAIDSCPTPEGLYSGSA